jgi:hypothetical protein
MKTRTMKNAIVTKSQLAAELECGSGTLSRIRDLPVQPDGQLNRVEVLQWLAYYTSGFGGGWGARRGKAGLQERAARLLDGGEAEVPEAEPDTASFTLEEFREEWRKARREGELFAANQLRRPGNVAIIAGLAAAFGCDAAGAYGMAIWYSFLIAGWVCDDDEFTEYEYDWAPLAERLGVPVDLEAWRKEAGRRVEAWDKAGRKGPGKTDTKEEVAHAK